MRKLKTSKMGKQLRATPSPKALISAIKRGDEVTADRIRREARARLPDMMLAEAKARLDGAVPDHPKRSRP